MSALDLSGADTSGIRPLDSGKYAVSVYEAEMTETKGRAGAKLPAGTPMLKIQWKVLNLPDDATRYLFSNFPTEFPEGYEHTAKMKGNIVNMLVAVGYDEKEVMSSKFKLDIDDLQGREATAIVGFQKGDADQNEIKGLKPAGGADEAGGDSGVL